MSHRQEAGVPHAPHTESRSSSRGFGKIIGGGGRGGGGKGEARPRQQLSDGGQNEGCEEQERGQQEDNQQDSLANAPQPIIREQANFENRPDKASAPACDCRPRRHGAVACSCTTSNIKPNTNGTPLKFRFIRWKIMSPILQLLRKLQNF
jgi:hypothetical protein